MTRKMDAIKDIDISRISLPIDTVVSDDMILTSPKSQEQFASMISKQKRTMVRGDGDVRTPEFTWYDCNSPGGARFVFCDREAIP